MCILQLKMIILQVMDSGVKQGGLLIIVDCIRNEYVPGLCIYYHAPTPGWDTDLTPAMCGSDFEYVCERVYYILSYLSGCVHLNAELRQDVGRSLRFLGELHTMTARRRDDISAAQRDIFTLVHSAEQRGNLYASGNSVLMRAIARCRVDASIGPGHGPWRHAWQSGLRARLRNVLVRG